MESLRIAMLYELGPTDDGAFLGGIESHILGLAKYLSRDHRVWLITGGIPGSSDRVEMEGFTLVRSDILGLVSRSWDPTNLTLQRQLFSIPAFLTKAVAIDADVYHGHIYASGFAALGAASLRSAASVNTIHGSYYDHWGAITGSTIKSLAYRAAERNLAAFLAKRCDKQIHTATDFAEKVISWGGPEEDIEVVLNGVDTEAFSPRVEPEESHELPVVMTVRRLVPKNGVQFFVEACREVRSECQFIVVGDGPERARLEDLSRRLGVTDRLEFRGAVPNNRLPGLLSAADVVVVPSLVEASSISLLEAMAMGKPTVVTKIPGIDEVASPERSVMVPPGDPSSLAHAVEGLLSDHRTADRLARRGRRYVVAERSVEKVADRTLAIYREAIG